jgi:hypothetical protein
MIYVRRLLAHPVNEAQNNRDLTSDERRLILWMIEHGEPEAVQFLPQLERLHVLPIRCPCGCASLDFSVDGQPQASGPMHLIADFLFGGDSDLCGTFLFVQEGRLSGLEVYGLAVDAPKKLPSPEILRTIPKSTAVA